MNSAIDIYVLASAKAKEIEAELKRLNRWSAEPLPSGKLENMGAFSSNTMAFEQWLPLGNSPFSSTIAWMRGIKINCSHLFKRHGIAAEGTHIL